MTKSRLTLLPLVLLGFGCGGSGGDSGTPASGDDSAPKVTVVKVNPSTKTLEAIGVVQALTVEVFDERGVKMESPPAASWRSLNAKIATVDQAGRVTALAVGIVKIRATVGGVSGDATLTIEQAIASLGVEPGVSFVTVGGSVTLKVTARDSSGVEIPNPGVSWTTSDPAVAQPRGSGVIDALAVGEAKIEAVAGRHRAGVSVRVVTAQPPIVFVGRNPDHDVYTVEPWTGNVSRVTNDKDFDYSPTWNPNHTEIAFGSEKNGIRDIYVIRANGTGQRRLVADVVQDQGPAWSPDGQFLALERLVPSNEIWRMTPTGTGLTRLAGPPENSTPQRPHWFPDNTEIGYDSLPNGSTASRELWIMAADGTNKRQVTNDGGFKFLHDISPDGQTLLFSWRRDGQDKPDLYTIRRDGSGLVRLTDNDHLEGGGAFSPDGSMIAIISLARVQLLELDGTVMRDVISGSPFPENGVDW